LGQVAVQRLIDGVINRINVSASPISGGRKLKCLVVTDKMAIGNPTQIRIAASDGPA